MKISDYAVKNYQFTLVIFLMIIALGIATILTMSRSEDPEMHAPSFTVVVVYPGSSPKDMEEQVVKPLEKEIYGLDNIKRIKTNIADGLAVLFVEYKYSENVDNKYQELVRVVNSERSKLPQDIYSIEVQKQQPSDVNIVQIALISENAPKKQLQYYAEKLQDELEKIKPLKNVDIYGLPDRQVRIELDLAKMAQMNLPIDNIINSIKAETATIPGGNILAANKVYNVKSGGNYQSIEDVENTIVYSNGNRNVLLKEIAKIYLGYADDNYKTRLNGYRCVFVTAAQKEGENITNTEKLYQPVLQQFKSTLPSNIAMVQHFDQAKNVNNRLLGLSEDFMIAIALVAITLLPLGFRSALIVMISIPLSLSIGIVLLNLFGYNLNQLSIVGLVVALGLLVDDSIVVTENIERWMLEGNTKMEATLKATKQIGLAVVGCTATLIIAFMPFVFMPEAAGDFIRCLPLAVIFCVLASMLVSLTITPFLSSRLLRNHIGHPEGNIFMRGMKRLIHATYSKLLDKSLDRPWLTIVTAVAIFIGSLFVLKMIGFSLFPTSEKPQFVINIKTPPQSNINYTDSIAHQVEAVLKKEQLVKYYATNVGKGNPRIYYNELPQNEHSDYAQVFVQLQEKTSPKDKLALIERLRSQWTPYLGAKVEVKNFEQGPPVVAPIEVRLFGDNLDTLRNLAEKVETMLKETPGTMYITNPVNLLMSNVRVDIQKEKAKMLGVPTANIDKAVRLAVAGMDMGKFTDDNNDDYNILLTRMKDGQPTLDVFKNLYVNNLANQSIPLTQVSDLKMETSPLAINHNQKQRVVSVSANLQKGVLPNVMIETVVKKMNAMPLPKGYHYTMGGAVEAQEDSFSGFTTIILVTVFFFFAVLVLEFGTFKSTLIVLSVIPLGIVGAALALWVTGNPLSFVAIVGLVALAGIEVKNTILLVDFTNQLRREGKSVKEAVREAGEIRFLPIILTTLTAIGGLIPIAVSSNPLISPLAIVLIGGLISSTLLSRLVTPVIYELIPPKL